MPKLATWVQVLYTVAGLVPHLALVAQAPLGAAITPPVRTYGPADGLPGRYVERVIVASDGAVWALADRGVVRHDGLLLSTVGADQGLPSSPPIDLLPVPGEEGRIIAVYARSLFRWSDSSFSLILQADSLSFSSVRPAVLAPDSVVMVQRGRLLLLAAGVVTDVHARFGLEGHTVRRIWSTRRGSLWVFSEQGLFQWHAGTLALRLPAGRGSLEVEHVAEDDDGRSALFSVIRPRPALGLWEWRQGVEPRRVSDDVVAALAVSGATSVVAREYAVPLHRVGRAPFRELTAVGSSRVVTAGIVPRGAIWMGGERGLLQLADTAAPLWRVRPLVASQLGNRAHEILRAADGTLWVATADGVHVISPDGAGRWIQEVDGEPLVNVTGLAEAPAGTIWLSSGGDFAGVRRFDGTRWRPQHPDDAIAQVFGHRLRVDAAGTLWFLGLGTVPAPTGRGGGAFVWQDGRWERWPPARGTPLDSLRVYEMVEDATGARWFATNDGVLRYHDGAWRAWTEAHGLIHGRIFSLAADPNGGVWFAHEKGRQLGRISPADELTYEDLPESIRGAEVWTLRQAPDGRTWLGGVGGIAVHDGTEWLGIGVGAGLPNSFIWPVLPESGRVLLGTGNGLVTLELESARAMPTPTVSVNVLEASRGTLVAEWRVGTARAETPSEFVQTRWRLDAGSWSAWSAQHQTLITGARRGRRTIEVQARDVLGATGEVGKASVFADGPAWRSPWVLWPVSMAFVSLLAAGLVRQRARRRERQLLQQVADVFRDLYDDAPEGYVLERLPDRRIVSANARAAAMFGVDCGADLGGVSLLARVTPESVPAIRVATVQLLQEGRSHIELRGTRVDGTAFDLELSSSGVRDASGAVVQSRTILRDVTARKQVARDLELFQRTLDQSFEPALWIWRNGMIAYTNPALRQMLGGLTEDAVGRGAVEVWPVVSALIGRVWSELDGREHVLIEAQLESPMAGVIPVEIAATRLLVGEDDLAILNIRDTRARQAEQHARRALAERQEDERRREALGTLGRAVANEFNNVLAGVLGQAELVLEDAPSGSSVQAHATLIVESALRGADVVAELLSSLGGLPRSPSDIVLSDAIGMLCDEHRSASAPDIEWVVRLDAGAAVRVAPQELRRAIGHLLRNAVEAHSGAKGTISVTTDIQDIRDDNAQHLGLSVGRYVRVRVRDTGCGMSAEQTLRAREPFFTTKPQALGLGLTIAQAVAVAAQGALRVESRQGEGTTCELLLPLVTAAPASPPAHASGSSPRGAKRQILVVDDESTVRLTTGLLLKKLGHEFVAAASAAEALAVLEAPTAAFNLVLTDMSMPGMNGFELAQAIRARWPALPVLVASAFVETRLRTEFAAIGVDVLLSKPFGREELAAAVHAVFGSEGGTGDGNA